MVNKNSFKHVLEQDGNSIKLIKYQNGIQIQEKNILCKESSKKDKFDEGAIKSHISELKTTLDSQKSSHTEKIERLIGQSDIKDACKKSFSIIESNIPKSSIKYLHCSQRESENSHHNEQDENTAVDSNTQISDQNEQYLDHDNKNITENEGNKKEQIVFDTYENEKMPFSNHLSVNDEIARNWLNLTYRQEYSPAEFQYFKLNNEINDMERYLKNRASECTQKVVFSEYTQVQNTFIEYSDWSASDHEKFIEYFSAFNKKFNVIAKLLNKDIRDVILHYYRTKKIEKYHKKKNGRISDHNLAILIEIEWTESERSKFTKLFEFYGKNWHSYTPNFTGKNVNDFKNLYRYLKKKNTFSESEEVKDRTKNIDCNKTDNNKDLLHLSPHHAMDDHPFSQQQATLDKIDTEKSISTHEQTENTQNCIIEYAATEKLVQDKKPAVVSKRKKTRRRHTPVKRIRKPVQNRQTVFQGHNSEDKENVVNKKENFNIVNEWNIDERQLFAIFYPFIGKKWADLSQYITTKKPTDCRNYFKHYFKNLSPEEQKLESLLVNIDRTTLSVPSTPKRTISDDFIENIGYIFKK